MSSSDPYLLLLPKARQPRNNKHAMSPRLTASSPIVGRAEASHRRSYGHTEASWTDFSSNSSNGDDVHCDGMFRSRRLRLPQFTRCLRGLFGGRRRWRWSWRRRSADDSGRPALHGDETSSFRGVKPACIRPRSVPNLPRIPGRWV